MSVILFTCDEERKETVKRTCLEIALEHYYMTVSPNTRVKYENEGEEVYKDRLRKLMNDSLCSFEDTDEGLKFTFDSTEDAGFEIADCVYGTGMGYSDDGLTFLKPFFDKLIEDLHDVPFEADCECYDKWVSDEYHCSYDGENFECDAEWMDFEE